MDSDAYVFSLLRVLPLWLIDPFGRFLGRMPKGSCRSEESALEFSCTSAPDPTDRLERARGRQVVEPEVGATLLVGLTAHEPCTSPVPAVAVERAAARAALRVRLAGRDAFTC